MPVSVVYSRTALAPAVQAEGLTAAQAKAALLAAPAGWLDTLVNYIRETGVVSGGLAAFRAAFPDVLKTGSDAGDSFLIRVAAIVEGGLAL